MLRAMSVDREIVLGRPDGPDGPDEVDEHMFNPRGRSSSNSPVSSPSSVASL